MSNSKQKRHFSPELFQFLRELEANNNREWFAENKARYLAVARDPMLEFIGDFGRVLRGLSPNLSADPRPVGGSLFRIYRDIRFSKDKRPYKTNVAAHFPHIGGKGGATPGFYLSLQPGETYVGGGLWHPDSATLKRVRQSIVRRAQEWRSLRGEIAVSGDRLKRPPKGFDPAHPLIEDLKQKDFVASVSFSEAQVCRPSFLINCYQACRQMSPLVEFLCRALGLNW